ncbi:DNA repair exonuclease [Limosilactobacillus sp. STM2_1]|uniref:DNA repair exonuclease n=1 Tax=Limosilactobacillus rudii TaxID=2759755 RepID=A0A7W3UIX6_9LACO|nr:DNA repair exonuclease [Limosilactobacillus rudii]MBB1080073.1 DNA repair exonuclease [Limosilactobacillus rudii]MBB1096439.1 DNA repair exonuclease [Limosilactobacillus rudii]MCD7133560.1 DNA repair exonuclease [Limosilactobacillus rudii]
MRFIHTADLHLDSPFLGLTAMPRSLWKRIHSSTFTAFQKIVDDAIELQVDFVLISGDIYDRDSQSIAATDFFTRQCERLNQAQIPLYLLYGNHDYQVVHGKDGLPANVYVFGNRVTTTTITLANHETVAISGFSYDQRWISEDPLIKYPPKRKTTWHIGMLHGAVQQNQDNHYAPFTISELEAKNYDYWALGHIHKHQLLVANPPIVYSGNPQGRHKNEAGQHGYYLVESQGNKLIPQFKPVAEIEWSTIKVAAMSTANLAELERFLSQKVIEAVKKTPFQLVELLITKSDQLSPAIQHLLINGDVLEHLQRQNADNNQWWIYNLLVHQSNSLPSMTDLDEDYWQQAANEVFVPAKIAELTASLARNADLASKLTTLDLQQLKRATTQLLRRED